MTMSVIKESSGLSYNVSLIQLKSLFNAVSPTARDVRTFVYILSNHLGCPSNTLKNLNFKFFGT